MLGRADVVSFTGSVEVGSGDRRRRPPAAGRPGAGRDGRAESGDRVADAELAVAAATIAAAVAGYAGQKCTATKRVIVVGDAARIHRRPGRPRSTSCRSAIRRTRPPSVGPVIDEAARDRVLDAAEFAAAGRPGAHRRATPDRDGLVRAPTGGLAASADHVLELRRGVRTDLRRLHRAPDSTRRSAPANGVRHGLVAGVYTNDLAAALARPTRSRLGMVKVNAPTAGVDFYLPFGGESRTPATAARSRARRRSTPSPAVTP